MNLCLRERYRGAVSGQRVPGGVVHKLPGDLREALVANPAPSVPGRTLRPWPGTSSSAGSTMPSGRRPENAAFAGPRRSSRRASVGLVAGQDAPTASAPAASRQRAGWPPHSLPRHPDGRAKFVFIKAERAGIFEEAQ